MTQSPAAGRCPTDPAHEPLAVDAAPVAPCVVRRTSWRWLIATAAALAAAVMASRGLARTDSLVVLVSLVLFLVALMVAALLGLQVRQVLVVGPAGVSDLRIAGVVAFVPWHEVRQFEVVPQHAHGRGLRVVVNADPVLRRSSSRRVRGFPVSASDGRSVLEAARWFAGRPEPCWRGRDGAVPSGARLRLDSDPAGPRRHVRGLLASAVGCAAATAVVAELAGVRGSLWVIIGAVFTVGLLLCVPFTAFVSTRPIFVNTRLLGVGVIDVINPRARWRDVRELGVVCVPWRATRAGRELPMRVQLRVVKAAGSREQVFSCPVPVAGAQLLADVLHAHRPDLI